MDDAQDPNGGEDPQATPDPQAAQGLEAAPELPGAENTPSADGPPRAKDLPSAKDLPVDTDKVDDTVLALLFLSLGPNGRAWKGLDWDTLSRLHAKGYIGNPVGKAKSVVMTEDGIARSERLFRDLFLKAD